MINQLFGKQEKLLRGLRSEYKSSLHDKIIWDEQMIGIRGARGVGKTTLLLQQLLNIKKDEYECLYVNLDDIAFPYDHLTDLAEEFDRIGGRYLLLDEIHKYENWSQELKNIYDNYPRMKVVFTGSSILDILKGKADLSRRAVVYNMNGLSFREFLQIRTGRKFDSYKLDDLLGNHEKYASDINAIIKPFQYFDSYLKFGYYPYFLQNVENYHLKLSNTISLTIETELPLLYNIDNQYIGKLKKFLKLLSSNIPFKPNISNLASAIGISWQSVIHYLHYLDEAGIIKVIYHEGKVMKNLTKPEMVYLHHPNHFYVFSEMIENKGNLRESFFVNQLSCCHQVEKARRGDFVVNGKYYFEIGGKNKTYHQIAGLDDSFIASDDIEYGFKNKIPLWLFGFLY